MQLLSRVWNWIPGLSLRVPLAQSRFLPGLINLLGSALWADASLLSLGETRPTQPVSGMTVEQKALTGAMPELRQLSIGQSVAFSNIRVPTEELTRGAQGKALPSVATDSVTGGAFPALTCTRVTAARVHCAPASSEPFSVPRSKPFFIQSLQDGLLPCESWLTPENYQFVQSNCDNIPPGGLFAFDSAVPTGTICKMTLCRHAVYAPGFKDYALGLDNRCCTFANFSEWADSEDDGNWTCRLINPGNGAVKLDCQTGNTNRWEDKQGCCSVFKTIPSTSNCGTWAPYHNDKPSGCASGCCIGTIKPWCTVPNPNPPPDANCPKNPDCPCIEPPTPP